MMKWNKASLLKCLIAAAVVVLLALTCRVTIIPDEVMQTTVNAAGETVNVEKLTFAEQYCADHWDSKIMPAVMERAVELPTFLADVASDLDAAGKSYGNRANETSAWSFCIKGNVKVLEIENAEKPNKLLLTLDVAPFDGKADCKLFYGKVFSSNIKNAIRDGVGFLRLDDFANQVEFANLTTAFDAKVKNEIFTQNDATDLINQELYLYGCISLTAATMENLVIVPVQIKIGG